MAVVPPHHLNHGQPVQAHLPIIRTEWFAPYPVEPATIFGKVLWQAMPWCLEARVDVS
jgi:hypothetical protein